MDVNTNNPGLGLPSWWPQTNRRSWSQSLRDGVFFRWWTWQNADVWDLGVWYHWYLLWHGMFGMTALILLAAKGSWNTGHIMTHQHRLRASPTPFFFLALGPTINQLGAPHADDHAGRGVFGVGAAVRVGFPPAVDHCGSSFRKTMENRAIPATCRTWHNCGGQWHWWPVWPSGITWGFFSRCASKNRVAPKFWMVPPISLWMFIVDISWSWYIMIPLLAGLNRIESKDQCLVLESIP